MGEGRLVNLACGYGHPAEVMDTSFALQALCLLHLKESKERLGNAVHPVPKEIDDRVAEIKLAAAGLSIDALSSDQEKYIQSWVV
jgi:adenosylhomocysteinase